MFRRNARSNNNWVTNRAHQSLITAFVNLDSVILVFGSIECFSSPLKHKMASEIGPINAT
jgi:hypothetical protein